VLSYNLHYEKFQDGTVKCIENEIPFEIPDSWAWCRLKVLGQYKKGPFGSNITKSMFVPDGPNTIKVYEQKNAINKDASLGTYFITSEKFQALKSFEVFPNDIIVSCAGTIGETYVLPSDMRPGIINQALMKITLFDINILEFYLIYFDSVLKKSANSQGHGVALKNIPPFDVLKKYLMPLPPLEEQSRIIQQVNFLLNKVNDISLQQSSIRVTVNSIKSKILDLAIRGKLVPQDQNDEPASVLIERIRSEKEKLIKQGKIKRDKNDSVIYKGDDNSYYANIPKNWSWTSLREITNGFSLNDGDWILSENMDENGSVKLIQLGSVGFMRYVDNGFKHITEAIFEKLSCTPVKPGYMLINRIISNKMCVCILPEIDGKLITTVDTCWISPNAVNYNLKYILYVLSSPQFQSLVKLSAGGNTRKRISKTNLISLPIPFPPLMEQQYIVNVIEKTFSYLDHILKSLT